MNSLQKMGGVSALIMAAAFVVGITLFVGVLFPTGLYDADVDPARKVAILADHQAIADIAFLVAFVTWGIFQVVLALALYDRLKAGSPAMAQTATGFGLILAGVVIASGMVAIVGIERVVELYGHDPAQAGTVWLAIESVELGLTQNEIVSGLWTLLISWAALQAGALRRALNYLGVVLGVLGLLTVVPGLDALQAVFGFGLIGWYVWLGIFLLRNSPNTAA